MVLSLAIILVMQSILVIGFKNYTPWADLAASASPHILYGTLLLGNVGKVWMAIVAILAVVSSVNSNIAAGMAKIGLLPEFFMKRNKKVFHTYLFLSLVELCSLLMQQDYLLQMNFPL